MNDPGKAASFTAPGGGIAREDRLQGAAFHGTARSVTEKAEGPPKVCGQFRKMMRVAMDYEPWADFK